MLPEAISKQADSDGAADEMVDLHGTRQLDRLNPMQAAADRAAALRTVRVPAKNARLDSTAQIRRIIDGHFGEKAVVGVGRGINDGVCDAFVGQEFGISLMQRRQLSRERDAIIGSQYFRTLLANLRGVNADPEAVYFRPGAPEGQVFVEVAATREHSARNGPVDVDFTSRDIFENAFVGRGLAANVVMLGKPVHRDSDTETGDLHPVARNRNYTAGNHQCEYAQLTERGENAA